MSVNPEPDFEVPDAGKLSDSPPSKQPAESVPPASKIAKAIERSRSSLMSRKGVTLIGEGLDATGQPAVVVGVRSVADIKNIPRTIGEFPVVVQVTGVIDAQ